MRIKFLFSLILTFITITCNAQKISGDWNGTLSAGPQKLSIIFKFSQDASGKDICTMDCLEQSIKDFPTEVAYLSSDSVSINIPTLGATYNGKRIDGDIKGKFFQSGMSFELNLKQGDVKVKRTQNPQPPFPYNTEEVTFVNPSDGASFAGTLTYPVGYEKMKKSSVPVVLMVTGSGQEDRNEEVFQHKPFLVIADYLARNGIATLRYDDRGVGGSKGDVSKLTTLMNMEDAIAGIKYLKGLNKFGKTGVLGHSEGGTVAFMIASRGKTDFIVSMAGTAVRGDSVISEQIHRQFQLNGYPQNAADMQIAKTLKADIPWMKYFINFDPSADIKGAKCPVMAINGSKDMQVIASSNLVAIKRSLPANSKNMVKEYDDLNHLFQHCATGNSSEYFNIEETISLEVLNDIATWINEIAK
jgi:pimeloyl-ACP methyl ester carboxylesterase